MFEILSSDHLRQLELLQMHSQRKFLGTRQGGNVSLKRGHGIEFADYRKYELGDDPRHIDWGVYGRTDRLFVKQFQEEQDLTLYFLLDSSASMHNPEADRKFHVASEIALGIAYIALTQNERVICSVPGNKTYGPFSNVGRIQQLGKELGQVGAVSLDAWHNGYHRFLHSAEFPGICVYISDFMTPIEDLQKQLEKLYARNLDVLAVRVVGPHDVNPFFAQSEAVFVDSETGEELPLEGTEQTLQEYQFRLGKHTDSLRNLFAKYRMRYLEWNSERPIIDFFSQDMIAMGFLRG